MRYYDLDILITSQMSDHYVTRAQSQTMGESQGRLLLADLEQICTAFNELPIYNIEEPALQNVGKSLFNVLFSGEIGTLYQRALGQVYADDHAGIRLRLKIDPPALAALPWELLYDSGRDCFLATSSETLLTRYIELARPIRDLQTGLPIRILVVIPGASGLDVEHEKRTIMEALAALQDAVEIKVLEGRVTSASVSRELVLQQFHILHFIGHGAFADDQGCLLLNSEEGDEHDLVSAREFSYNFQDYPSMKLVVLNSCSGAASSSQSLTGVAQELVQKSVPSVIAMREEITDAAAKIFAKEFYQKLCLGYERGRVDIAISHARKRLIAAMGDTCEFANPVLFMRSPTGVIFHLGDGEPIASMSEVHTNNAVTHTLNYNIAQIRKGGGENAAAEVAKETQAKTQVRARVVDFYKRIAIAAAPRVIAMALVVSMTVFFASQIRAFKIVDDYLAAGLHWWYGVSDQPLDPEVAIIGADQSDEQTLGQFGPGWRDYHAALMGGLAGGREKPSVIAIDLTFGTRGPNDEKFGATISKARLDGVQIVGSQIVEDDGELNAESKFVNELQSAFGDGWGDVYVGGVTDLPWFGGPLHVYEYEIASLPKNSDLSKDIVVVPSLALKAVMQHYYDAHFPPQAYYNEGAGEVVIKAVHAGQFVEKHVPVTRTDLRLNIILEYASKIALEANTHPYRDVYRWATSNQPEDQLYLDRLFKDKIVMIGYSTVSDTHETLFGKRSGIEFHANAVSNLLKGEYIPEISRTKDLAIIVLMVVVGVLLQTKIKPRLRTRFHLGKFDVPVLLFIVLILYVVAAIVYMFGARVSFHMSYHIAALLIAYWAIAIFRKQLNLAGTTTGSN